MMQKFQEHLAIIAGMLASFAVIGAALAFGRKQIVRFIRGIGAMFTAPSSMMRMEAGMKGRDEKLDKLLYAFFNDGENGALHLLGKLAAHHDISLETAPCPQFECSLDGNNTRVNEAYRTLVQVWNSELVPSHSYRIVIYGDLKDEYLENFDLCVAHRIDFIGTVDFHNPITGAHRGRWKVHARAKIIGDACIYFGSFIQACDVTAGEIAMENGWTMRIFPSQMPGSLRDS